MKRSLRRPKNAGTILVCVLACLIVITALIGSAIQSALRGRKSARMQQQLRQTELLCEAGVLRAAQSLKKSSSYDGEIWRPELMNVSEPQGTEPAGDQANGQEDQPPEATVEIRVTDSDDPATRSVEVIARLDSHLTSAGVMQRSHRFPFQIPSSSTSENP